MRFEGRSWRLIDYDGVVPDQWEGVPTYTEVYVSPEVARSVHATTMSASPAKVEAVTLECKAKAEPRITKGCDVWALGLVMFELFVGVPFRKDLTVQDLAEHPELVLEEVRRHIKEESHRDILEKMLRVDPQAVLLIVRLPHLCQHAAPYVLAARTSGTLMLDLVVACPKFWLATVGSPVAVRC